MSAEPIVLVKHLGSEPYLDVWARMQQFTNERTDSDQDQLWLVEHPPVFTQGQAGKAEHVLAPGNIPLVKTDRGGQVTYHGPGQMVAYPLLNLRRLRLGVRDLVTQLEQSVVNTLATWNLTAYAKADAPGVYIDERKIASLGLRVRRGCSYHGLSLNVNMDLEPFLRINPCGYNGLEMTQLADWVLPHQVTMDQVQDLWITQFTRLLGITPQTQQPKTHQ